MAVQAVVGRVMDKLAYIKEKEPEQLGEAREKVKRVLVLLIRICTYLKDADSKRHSWKVHNWLNELCDLAYHIEDTVDTFFLKDYHRRNTTFMRKLKVVFNKSHVRMLATELNIILIALEEISKIRIDHGIIDNPHFYDQPVITPLRRATNSKVIGRQADQINIMKMLSNKATRAVITIVGPGGVGKTTLAQMVYKSVRAEFEYHIMISISRHMSLTDLLKKMLCRYEYIVPKYSDVEGLIFDLRRLLSSKRYLIILDDVWDVQLWDELNDALPDVDNGSRVLMTTQSFHIVNSAYPKMEPYQLPCLNDTDSLDLLLEKALPSEDRDNEYSSDLIEVASHLSNKCKGFPLALTVVGGILSTKEHNYFAWERVLRTTCSYSDNNDCLEVLAMGYEVMPNYLKECFLYLASFPKHYKISAKRLIRMWIAERFLRKEQSKTMEEQADDYLEELFQRNMVQVSSRCMNGSIKSFHVHDLVHDLAIREAGLQNFVTVFSQKSYVNNLNRGIRRASLHYCSQQFSGYADPITRSLLLFGSSLNFPMYTNCRLLRVLELVDVRNNIHDLKEFEKLIHLKYLGLRNCPIGIFSCSFRGMNNLETLDVRGTRAELPSALWAINTLRHVLCDDYRTAGLTLNGPISGADLGNLQTMRWVSPLRTWDRVPPCLNNLRKLGVHNFFDQWVTVTNLLQKLPSLISLGIKGTSLPMDIVHPQALPNYQNLQSLYLDGKWSKNVTFKASLFPPHLVKFTLVGSRLEQNPMSELGKLESLKKLCLREHVTNYSSPTICPVGFPVLQYLEVGDSSIKDLTVAMGVMPQLTHLRVCDDIVLNLPPELMHVTIKFVKNRLVPKVAMLPLQMPIPFKLDDELSQVQNEVEEISESRINTDETEAIGLQNFGIEATTIPLQSTTSQQVDETKVLGRQEIVEEADTMYVQRATYQEVDKSEVIRLETTVGEAATMPLRTATSQEVDEIEVLGQQNIVREAVTMPLQSATFQEIDETEVLGRQEIVGEGDTAQLRRAIDQEVDETEVVGLQVHKNNIMKLLHAKETPRRVVITIVGTGGLGKTTVAHMVYQSAKAEFDCHMMLSITQKFSLTDLLRKMLSQLKYSIPENQDVPYLVSKLKSGLSRSRYLIVLDDVWRVDLWDQVKDALPDVKNGSRVLMTSRFVNVANSSDPDMETYELQHLNDRDSLDLLLKKALPSQDPSEEYHSDLLELADELSKKCKGLPVALIVLGGILSTKRGSYPMWKRVLRTMDWHSDGKACMQVLEMSYKDMPNYLKKCFKYLAVFPEDYEICAKRLIRMLVAEEFLTQEGGGPKGKSKEKKAQDCLEELFERSMVQVSSRCMNGLIKSFHVHDLLRDLAVHEARQENFVMVFSQASNVNQPNREIRRASLSYSPLSLKYLDPNTCASLLLFGIGQKFTEFYNFKVLRVLELVGVRNNTHDLKGFEKLNHLKYLGFRNCHIGIFSCSFHGMNSLETLDVRGTRAELSNALWKIRTLRHVLCDDDPIAGATLHGPISTAELTNLQTMQWISPLKEWAKKLPILENLCKLGVSNFFDDWVTVTNLLPTLSSLVSLRIKGISLPMDIVFSRLPMNLQSLYIEGNWRSPLTLRDSLFPAHLVKLTLVESRLQQNPMPDLGKLKSLKKLCLREHVRNYLGPTICPEGFPVLQYLEVTDYDIKDLTVAQGVMPKLTYLKLHDDIVFKRSPGLQHVTVVIR